MKTSLHGIWERAFSSFSQSTLVRTLWVATFLLLAPRLAWAQEEVGDEAEAKWLLAYCLVALLIGLAVYSMCRPSVRRKKSES